jgi:hypothetical protein
MNLILSCGSKYDLTLLMAVFSDALVRHVTSLTRRSRPLAGQYCNKQCLSDEAKVISSSHLRVTKLQTISRYLE